MLIQNVVLRLYDPATRRLQRNVVERSIILLFRSDLHLINGVIIVIADTRAAIIKNRVPINDRHTRGVLEPGGYRFEATTWCGLFYVTIFNIMCIVRVMHILYINDLISVFNLFLISKGQY